MRPPAPFTSTIGPVITRYVALMASATNNYTLSYNDLEPACRRRRRSPGGRFVSPMTARENRG
jgi:hypothetical protein